jgi:hypothetical protein
MTELLVSNRPRFGRIPDAESRSGTKRGYLYRLAGRHPGLFRKAGSATIVDLEFLDRILADLPAAAIKAPDATKDGA